MWKPGLWLPGYLKETGLVGYTRLGFRKWVSKVPEVKEQMRGSPRQHDILEFFSGELGDGQVSTRTQARLCSVSVTCLYGPFVNGAKTCDSVLGHKE